jgi:D-alanine-D-alanine ligase
MKKKLKIGLIFGGKSGEHEVSLISARSIFEALDKKKYDVVLIGISKKGDWHLGNPEDFWIDHHDPKAIRLNLQSLQIMAVNKEGKVFLTRNGKNLSHVDVFFPITHGTFGEDGCLQGFLELLNAAYVGPNVLGSAVGMDKDVMKRLFREAGIATPKFVTLRKGEDTPQKINQTIKELKFPIFVKPANLGSSVGISKAQDRKELEKATQEAFRFDTKIILEQTMRGREVECAVLGNEKPVASRPGEIKLQKGHFYSYDAKYIDDKISIPDPNAKFTQAEIKKIQAMAIKIFKVLCCEGMGRVDFFLEKNGKLYANEINTLPGFTSISMYPKMFANSGISYPKLLDTLIKLAIDRKKRNDKLLRSYN